MPRFKIAHIREQGQDIIIVPLEDSFGQKSEEQKLALVHELQLRARAAGLAGEVVPAWNNAGRMGFIAPTPWHPFFRGLSISDVVRMLNRELSW